MYQATQMIYPPEISPDVVKVMVTIERPPSQALKDLNRGERFQFLQASAEQARRQIIVWIKDKGLSHEVAYVSQPTAFNLLFVEATHRVATMLELAPCVVSVAMTGRFQVDLLDVKS